MNRVVGMDCSHPNSRGRRLVQSLVQKVERRYDLYWRWIRERRVWRCLTDQEKPTDVEDRTQEIQRRARRNRRVINSTDWANLSDRQKASMAVSVVVNGAIEILSSKRSHKRLLGQVNEAFLPDPEEVFRVCCKQPGSKK